MLFCTYLFIAAIIAGPGPLRYFVSGEDKMQNSASIALTVQKYTCSHQQLPKCVQGKVKPQVNGTSYNTWPNNSLPYKQLPNRR